MSVHNLVIAIGGTGTRVVSELIKNFRNDQHKVPSNVAFAIVDAHRKPEVQVGDDQTEMVSVDEPIWYSRKHQELLGHPNPAILRAWWPKGIQAKDEVTFADGCGAIRPNGRFFVGYYGDAITRVISKSLDRLRDANHHLGEKPKTNIYIIASLGNGTGGGAFMGTAIIANRLAAESGLAPNVIGILVPSTTTSAVNSGSPLLVPRVGANGVGSLIELQYEFNRRANDITRNSPDFWTETPSQRASLHTLNAQHALSDATISPFTQAFLIDSTNTNHAKRTYEEVLQVAARSLHALIAGADEGKRLLDSNTHVSGNFGSLGFCRMRTPVNEAIDYILANLMQEAERQLEVVDLDAEYPELRLNFEPDICQDGTIKGSVQFVLGTVARINESDVTDPLFARLRSQLQPVEPLAGVNSADDCKAAIQTCRAIFRRRHEDVLKVTQEFLHGSARELPTPRPTGDALRAARDKLGVAYLLRQVATKLVEAGKFKLLAEWLEEFKRQVQDAMDSVRRTEYRRTQSFNLDNPPEDLNTYLARYEELSNGLLSFFRRSSRDESLSGAQSELNSWYNSGLAHMEAKGALTFYEDLLNLVEMYLSITHEVCASLKGKLFNRSTDEELTKTARFFSDHLSATAGRIANTLEVVVGNHEDIRSILEDLMADTRHDGMGLAAALASMRTHNLSIFQQTAERQDISQPLLQGVKPSKAEGGLQWSFAYAETLKAQLRSICQQPIAAAMGLEALLERQASKAISRFLRDAVKPIQQGTANLTPSALSAEQALRAVTGRRYSDARSLLMQPTPDERGVMKLAIRHSLETLMNLANANWYPSERSTIEPRQMLLVRTPRDGSPFAEVVRELAGPKVSITDNPYFDLNLIDCVTCEIGARLEHLFDQLVKPHLESYRRALFPRPGDEFASNYTPHSEQHYLQAGQQYVRWLDRRATAHQNGALLLALSLYQHPDFPHLFHVLERNADGSYRWVRELKAPNGSVVAIAGASVAARSSRDLIDWLNGQGPDGERGRTISDVLTQTLTQDLLLFVQGDPYTLNQTGVGLEKARESFSRHKATLRQRTETEALSMHQRSALVEQVQFLSGFVASLENASETTLKQILS